MRMYFFAATAFAFCCFFADHANADLYSLSGPMDVLQAGTNGGFGAGTGNGVGEIFGTYDDTSNLLNYTITWANLTSTVTNMHFHLGAPGVSGGVAVAIPSPWSSPQSASGVALTAGQETDLLAGNWYVNIHTTNFTGGEIRGQVRVSAVPEPSSAFAGLAFLIGVGLRRRRSS